MEDKERKKSSEGESPQQKLFQHSFESSLDEEDRMIKSFLTEKNIKIEENQIEHNDDSYK